MNRDEVTTVLIDGDVHVYAIGFAAETKTYEVEGIQFGSKKELKKYLQGKDDTAEILTHVQVDPLPIVLATVKSSLEEILFNTGCEQYQVYLTKGKTFRDDLVDYYKANRDPKAKPSYYNEIRQYLVDEWGAEYGDYIEADDLCGIYQDKTTIISSIDKDLDTIPGWHYNPNKKIEYYLSKVEALRNLYGQWLTGDTADNIPGLFKLTKVKCRAKYLEPLVHMEDEASMYHYVCNTYSNAMEASNYKDWSVLEIELRDTLKLLTILQEPLNAWRDIEEPMNTVDTNSEVSSS